VWKEEKEEEEERERESDRIKKNHIIDVYKILFNMFIINRLG